MPKFNKGDRVRVSLASHSPYRGQIGVVDENPSRYSGGFWYMVRFDWKGLHPATLFMEEDLEDVSEEILPGETTPVVKFTGRSRRSIGNKIILGLTIRKWLLIALIVVLIPTTILVVSNNIGTKTNSSTPFESSPVPTKPGVAARLEFITQPGGAIAGQPFSIQPVVAVEDGDGNTITDYSAPVKLAIYNYNQIGAWNAELSGTNTVNAVNGIATFKDISIDLATSDYILMATSGDLESVLSSNFTVAPGAPEMLIFITQPVGDGAGSWFSTQPAVAILDAYLNIVTDSTAEVTLSITPGSGTSGAILSGVVTLKAKNGVASFGYLSVDLVGRAYTLTATSPGLKSAQSQGFNITSTATTS
jgi:hypothetical protein